jgi:MFS family permease
VTQLPLGKWLDLHGPKKVILSFLVVAVLGCICFAMAQSFVGLWLARVLCGVGVSACLMSPLTGYRRWMDPGSQLRANSWMLMTGPLGMLSSTLPVQWLMPITGWRPDFCGSGRVGGGGHVDDLLDCPRVGKTTRSCRQAHRF